MQIFFVSCSLLFEDEVVVAHLNTGFVLKWTNGSAVPKHQIKKQEGM